MAHKKNHRVHMDTLSGHVMTKIFINNGIQNILSKIHFHEKRASYLYRTATTVYPCFLPDLGEFNGSWSYKTCPVCKITKKKNIFVRDNPKPFTIMENKNTSVFYNGLIWGAILGFAGIIYNVILYMLDQNLTQALGYAGILITIIILIIGLRSFRDNVRDGVLPFGPAFLFGFVVILVSSLIGIIYAYLLWTVIDPDIIARMKDLQMEKMLEKGVPGEALDQAMEISGKFMTPVMMAIFGFISSLFMGTIVALIIAAIFKKDEPEQPVIE